MKRAAALILSAFALSACAELGLPDLDLLGSRELPPHEDAKKEIAGKDSSAIELTPFAYNNLLSGKSTSTTLNLQAGKVYSFMNYKDCRNGQFIEVRNSATNKLVAATIGDNVSFKANQTGRYTLTLRLIRPSDFMLEHGDSIQNCNVTIYMFEGNKLTFDTFSTQDILTRY